MRVSTMRQARSNRIDTRCARTTLWRISASTAAAARRTHLRIRFANRHHLALLEALDCLENGLLVALDNLALSNQLVVLLLDVMEHPSRLAVQRLLELELRLEQRRVARGQGRVREETGGIARGSII